MSESRAKYFKTVVENAKRFNSYGLDYSGHTKNQLRGQFLFIMNCTTKKPGNASRIITGVVS